MRPQLLIRLNPAVKTNTQLLLQELYDIGLRDDTNLSGYMREALAEKRARDTEALEKEKVRIKAAIRSA